MQAQKCRVYLKTRRRCEAQFSGNKFPNKIVQRRKKPRYSRVLSISINIGDLHVVHVRQLPAQIIDPRRASQITARAKQPARIDKVLAVALAIDQALHRKPARLHTDILPARHLGENPPRRLNTAVFDAINTGESEAIGHRVQGNTTRDQPTLPLPTPIQLDPQHRRQQIQPRQHRQEIAHMLVMQAADGEKVARAPAQPIRGAIAHGQNQQQKKWSAANQPPAATSRSNNAKRARYAYPPSTRPASLRRMRLTKNSQNRLKNPCVAKFPAGSPNIVAARAMSPAPPTPLTTNRAAWTAPQRAPIEVASQEKSQRHHRAQ